MNSSTTIIVPPDAPAIRLDRYLAGQYPDLSRTRLQSLIGDGHIRVNDKAVRPSHIVTPGDRIDLSLPAPVATDIRPEDIQLTIVYEDADLIIVNKPVGMVVHPAAGNLSGTLVNALLFHRGDQLSGVGGEIKPGVVHRLDKDTSGLLMIAKHDRAHLHLSAQLQSRALTREYHALVWGNVAEDEGVIDVPIGRHPTDRLRMMAFPDEASKRGGPSTRSGQGRRREARTHFVVLERFRLATYVLAKLETGRTHQIRVHFQHLHHPVVGDPVYGGRETYVSGLWPEKRPLAQRMLKLIDHQALHAKRLAFIHPTSGQTMQFDSELPPPFAQLLAFCRELNP